MYGEINIVCFVMLWSVLSMQCYKSFTAYHSSDGDLFSILVHVVFKYHQKFISLLFSIYYLPSTFQDSFPNPDS
jgi:hypothetical protein